MFLSDESKLLFFHVPKVAGSSIHAFLKEKYNKWHIPDTLPPIHHIRVKDYLKYNPDKIDYFKFSFVRNPFERLLSAYSDYTQIRITPQQDKDYFLKHNLIDKEKLDKSLSVYRKFYYDENHNFSSYKEFCNYCTGGNIYPNQEIHLLKNPDFLFINKGETFEDFCEKFVESGWSKDIHFIPQTEILCDNSGKLLVDYVGRHETINNDLSKLSNILGYPIELNNPKFKGVSRKTNHLHYSQVYNDRTRKIVENVFKNDLELFNYSF